MFKYKHYTYGEIILDIWAYQPYILVGPPVWRLVLAPLAVNSLTTAYKWHLVNNLAVAYDLTPKKIQRSRFQRYG